MAEEEAAEKEEEAGRAEEGAAVEVGELSTNTMMNGRLLGLMVPPLTFIRNITFEHEQWFNIPETV